MRTRRKTKDDSAAVCSVRSFVFCGRQFVKRGVSVMIRQIDQGQQAV